MFDFNGDGKVDVGEEYTAYKIFEDVNSDSGLFSGRSRGGDLSEKLAHFLAYMIVLAPVFIVLFVFKWLTDIDYTVGAVFMLLVFLALLGWVIKINVEKSREDRIKAGYEERAREIVAKEVFTDEEIRKHASIWAIMHDSEWKWKYHQNIEACWDLIEDDYRRRRIREVAEELRKDDEEHKEEKAAWSELIQRKEQIDPLMNEELGKRYPVVEEEDGYLSYQMPSGALFHVNRYIYSEDKHEYYVIEYEDTQEEGNPFYPEDYDMLDRMIQAMCLEINEGNRWRGDQVLSGDD